MADTERDWKTKAGLRAICVEVKHQGADGHLCGYVEVPKDHWLFEVGYNKDLENISKDILNNDLAGKRGPIDLMIFALGDKVRPGDLLDVHGSLTFSGVPFGVDDGFWYGFDCRHCGDTREVCNEDYVAQECESLAEQLCGRWAKPPQEEKE